MAERDLQERVCLITGASSGLGRATALALARRGARLWLLCRDAERGRAALEEIRARSDNDRLRLVLADLGCQAEVRRAAAEVLDLGEPLHVLIHNAGAVFLERRETTDGIEATLALNHLAPFLLTRLLLERLQKSAPSRVITVSSAGHSRGRIRLDDLGATRGYQGFLQYCDTKLANLLFTHELARRLEGTGVAAYSVHPGAVRTSLGMNNHGWVRVLWKLAHPFFRSPERGAETCVWLASASGPGASGGHFVNGAPRRSSSASYDEELARALWEASSRLVIPIG